MVGAGHLHRALGLAQRLRQHGTRVTRKHVRMSVTEDMGKEGPLFSHLFFILIMLYISSTSSVSGTSLGAKNKAVSTTKSLLSRSLRSSEKGKTKYR